VVSSRPEIGGVPGHTQAEGVASLIKGLRSSGQGGKAGTPTGRTPCFPHRLPDGVPVTFRDRTNRKWFAAEPIR
jgi:hypothetical protein